MTKLNDTIATGNRGWQAGPGQLMPNLLHRQHAEHAHRALLAARRTS